MIDRVYIPHVSERYTALSEPFRVYQSPSFQMILSQFYDPPTGSGLCPKAGLDISGIEH
jgi:hypothetical protein